MADDFDPYYQWLGVPPKDQPANHYRLLGVELFESNPDVIESAADRQMAHVRSFQSGPHGGVSQKLLNEITTAKLCLLNKDKKAEYDAKLRADKEAAEAAARPKPRAVRATRLPAADPAQPFDEGEDVVQSPAVLPKLSLDLKSSQPGSSQPGSTHGSTSPLTEVRRRRALGPALIAGVAGGVLVVAVVAFLILRGGSTSTTKGTGSGKTTAQTDPLKVDPDKTTPIEPAKKTSIKPVQGGTTPNDSFAGTKAGQEWDSNGVRMKFCWCPPGTFMMGSPLTEPGPHSQDPIEVTLTRGFWLGKYEATQEEWQRVMGISAADQAAKGNFGQHLLGEGNRYPIYYVNHHEATEFCRKLTETERRAGRLPTGWQYRLPTEAQWEYACRAATTTATAFGDKLSSKQANFDGTKPFNGAEVGPFLNQTTPVGNYPANRWGFHDMHGNVWEWCRDWEGAIPSTTDPEVTEPSHARANRGGGWHYPGEVCRSGIRNGATPDHRIIAFGFRVALVQAPDEPGTVASVDPPKKEPGGSAEGEVYLDDLQEVEFKVLAEGTLGKHGETGLKGIGAPDGKVSFQGRKYTHAVSTHPASGEVAYVGYKLDGQFGSFRATAALLDLAAGEVRTRVTFKALADGKVLWTSKPIDRAGAGESCSIDLQGAKTLRLEAHSSGDNSGQYAAWLNPVLVRGSSQQTALVYLDDLREIDSTVGYGILGKHGESGYDDRKVVVQGKAITHALSMHPPKVGASRATYELNGAYRAFRATAALFDVEGETQARNPMIFKVVGDDRVIWHSPPIQRLGSGEECAVNIEGVKVLRVEVHCLGGDNYRATATWVNPALLKVPVEVRPSSAVRPSNVVYLDDLQETDAKFKYQEIGKHGARGHNFPDENHLAKFRGKVASHAISMHTEDNDSVYVTYNLKETFVALRGTAVLLDTAGRPPATLAIFKVLGDDKVLWQSDPTGANTERPFSVNVRGVKRLKLQVDCPGDSTHVHAAWLSPALLKNSSDAVAGKAKSSSRRLPVPKENELEAARRQVRETFKADIQAAVTPGKKEALAKKLIDRAKEGRESPDLAYAMLDEARETALAALDVESAVKASEQLATGYEVDGAATMLDVLTRLSAANLTVEKRKGLVDAMLDVVDRTAGEENFKAAADLLALVAKTMTKVTDADLRRKTGMLKDRVEQTRVWLEEAEAARTVLVAKADDPVANKALGKYLCFAKDDWDNGLPYLIKGDDPKLKAAALLDEGKPSTGASQAAAGDAWWDLTAPASGYWKMALQKRAEHWYQMAVADLKDPTKGIVEKRLAILEKSLGEAGDASAAALTKRIVGEFFLVATGKKNAKTTTTLAFAADGAVSDNRVAVGKWTVESGQIRITFSDASRGTVALRSRGKDALAGLASGETPNWDLKRVVVVAVWDVFLEPFDERDRLTLYSNGKAQNPYSRNTWSMANGNLTLDWPDYIYIGGLRGTFRVDPSGKIFRGRGASGRTYRGERVAASAFK